MAKARQMNEWKGPVDRYIRRVLINGQRKYRVQVGGTGRGNRRSKVCGTLDDALAWREALVASGGALVKATPTDEIPVDLERALRHHGMALRIAGKPDAAARTEQLIPVLRALLPELLVIPLTGLTAEHCAIFVDRRRAGGIQDSTIIRDLRALRAAVRKARPDFSIPSTVFPTENLTRVRILPDRERREIFPYIAEQYGARFARFWELAMLAVVRLNDLRTLRREHVRLPERLLLLPRTKGNPPRPRQARLTDRAVALLRDQLASHGHDHVFGHPRTGEPYTRIHLSRIWRRAARAFNLHGFTGHDLRHHAPTLAVNAGANDATLMAMGGWRDRKSVRRYASVMNPTVDHYLALAEAGADERLPVDD